MNTHVGAGITGVATLLSFVTSALPYLQASSILIACVVGILTIRKLLREEKRDRNRAP